MSVHHRYIQPEFQRAEAGADVFGDADDRGGEAAADLAGLGQILAVGQADDRPRKEGIACAGGVDDVHLLGGHDAAGPVVLGVDGPQTAHRHHHAGHVGAVDVPGQHLSHLGGGEVAVVVREEQPGLLLVADEAVDLLQIVAALHGDAHVGDGGKDLLFVLLGVVEHLLDGLFLEVQLDGDAVAVPEDLVALLFQQGGQRGGVGPLGDGRVDVAVVVEDGQPCAHAVGDFLDVSGVDLVVVQFVDDVLPHAAVIHKAHEGGAQLHVGNVLRHIPAHAAVHLLHPPGVPSAGDVGGERIALDVHKNCADDYDSHSFDSFPKYSSLRFYRKSRN